MEFEFVAGDVALDFAATVAERGTTHLERLTSPRDLADWLVKAGLLDSRPRATGADLAAARDLREGVYPLLVALTAGAPLPPSAVRTINRYAAVPPPAVRLLTDGRRATTGDVTAALSAIARATIDLASSERRELIRWCSGERCTRAFLDRSRARARQWCAMAGCGDRAKAAAYRQRRGAVAESG